jgi:phage baseplate assembly protein W
VSSGKYININFPFVESPKGFFVDLNELDTKAIKANIMHLLLTKKGERYYNPEFGTNLWRYIFQPNDSITFGEIQSDITQTLERYFPKLKVNKIEINNSEDNDYLAIVRVDYTITDDVFQSDDFIIINL